MKRGKSKEFTVTYSEKFQFETECWRGAKKVIGILGEVLRKFGQFNSPGVVFFIKDGRVWREK